MVGAGLERGPFRFNYAFAPNPDLGASNRFDLAVRFGAPLSEEARLRTLLDQARADLHIGHFAHGLETLEEIKRLSPSNPEAEDHEGLANPFRGSSTDMLFQQGEQAFKDGFYEKSADFFRKLGPVQPDLPAPLRPWHGPKTPSPKSGGSGRRPRSRAAATAKFKNRSSGRRRKEVSLGDRVGALAKGVRLGSKQRGGQSRYRTMPLRALCFGGESGG